MLQYMDMDIYKQELGKQTSERKVLISIMQEMKSGKLSPDLERCLVKYEDIIHHVDELRKKNRSVDALLEKGLDSYKEGRIIIFDGELTSYDQYKLPPYLLFIPFGDKLIFNINGLKKTNWKKVGPDDYEYTFSNVLVELKFILVTAQIMYEMLISGKDKLVINDSKLMRLVTETYVSFFKKAIGRLGSNIEDYDIHKFDYTVSKFFYMHSLGFVEREADKIVSNMYDYEDYQLSDIRLSEELLDYDTLFTFVPTMTKLFYKKEINAMNLVNSWINSFGSSIFTEIEYFPAMLTHLLVLIFGVEFVNERHDLRSRKDAIYQRLTVTLK